MENLSVPTALAGFADPVSALEQDHAIAVVSALGEWVNVVADATATDNSGSDVQTLAQVLAGHATAAPLAVHGRGTHAAFRLRYDDGCTPDVDPVIEVFGIDIRGNVGKLRNLNGAAEATLTTAEADDAEDGTYIYTTPDDAAIFDLRGYAWIVVAIKTAFTVAAGSDTSAVQAKVF